MLSIMTLFVLAVTPAFGEITVVQQTENKGGFTTLNLLTDNASPTLGSNNAPITMIEFGDYQDFYSNQFYHNAEPDIVKNYINTGKVKMVFKDFVIIGQDSVNAAHAAHCAQEQNKFWQYHDTLYNNWKGENTGWASSNDLLRFAKDIGLDTGKFSQCMSESTYLTVVQGSLSNAKDLGLTATPNFFIIFPDHSITKVVGAQPFQVFDNIFKSVSNETQPQEFNEQMVENTTSEILSHQKINVNTSEGINTLIFKGVAFRMYSGPIKAFYYFDAALKIDQNNQEAQKQRDYAYQQILYDTSRITNYDNMLKKDPNSVEALAGECQYYSDLHDYATSVYYCDKILKNNPDDQTVINFKYAALVGQHRYEEALPLSYKIPDAPFNENYLKIIPSYQLGKYNEILQNLDTKIQLDSSKGFSVAALLLMIDKAVILEKMEKSSDSNSIISIINASLGPGDNIDVLKGTAYFNLQDYPMAIHYFEKTQVQGNEVGHMKVVAEDETAKPNSLTLHLTSGTNFFEEMKQFFTNLFHWN